jgi:HAD superfamily hydrolase (TIGR01484 family)
MAVKLVALDIDGTVVAPGALEPSAAVASAVGELTRRGVAVILASGRMFPGTIAIARHLGLRTPVICQQGCSVHLPDGRTTHEFPISRELALDVIGYARSIERAYEWFNPVRYLASAPSDSTREYGRVSGIVPEYRPDPENSGLEPTGVGIISSHAEANGIHRVLIARHPDALHVLDFPEVTVAVHPDANKGHSLALICADLGIDRHEVVAIGDSVNDATMLAWAGRGIAMPHSDAYARDSADEILGEGEDVLAEILRHL